MFDGMNKDDGEAGEKTVDGSCWEVGLLSQTAAARPIVIDGETGYDGCERSAGVARGEGESGNEGAATLAPDTPMDIGLSWRHLTVT
jgi:hypothetical protein